MTRRELLAALSNTLMGFGPGIDLTEEEEATVDDLTSDKNALISQEPLDGDDPAYRTLIAKAERRREAHRDAVVSDLKAAGWRLQGPTSFQENAGRDRWEWTWSVTRTRDDSPAEVNFVTTVTVAVSRSDVATTEYETSPADLALASAGLTALQHHLAAHKGGPAPVIDESGNTTGHH